jgi:hypothetical protein
MDRRTLLLGAASTAAAAASGVLILTQGFNPPPVPQSGPKLLSPNDVEASKSAWVYRTIDAPATGELAYQMYEGGGCMYASFGSILTQLAQLYGQPYASFPYEMMKYGASGIGEYGSVCGALNGVAAVVGLFIPDKGHRNILIEEFFAWYEKTALPVFEPKDTKGKSVSTVSDSVLCHVSTAIWAKASGNRTESEERTERCKRLTADVTQKAVGLLNQYVDSGLEHASAIHIDATGCIQCHGKEGKLGDIKGKMNCASCHEPSTAHTLFADVHYHFMKD